jgi:hypothetical protein
MAGLYGTTPPAWIPEARGRELAAAGSRFSDLCRGASAGPRAWSTQGSYGRPNSLPVPPSGISMSPGRGPTCCACRSLAAETAGSTRQRLMSAHSGWRCSRAGSSPRTVSRRWSNHGARLRRSRCATAWGHGVVEHDSWSVADRPAPRRAAGSLNDHPHRFMISPPSSTAVSSSRWVPRSRARPRRSRAPAPARRAARRPSHAGS